MAGYREATAAGRWLAAKVALVWAGLSIGVSFLATPAKFLAPTLTLPVALEVGQQTFRVYHPVESVFAAAVILLGAGLGRRPRWAAAAAVPALLVAAQVFWLIPALDLRVAELQAGRPVAPSSEHALYVALEGVKIVWLLILGLAGDLRAPRRFRAADDALSAAPMISISSGRLRAL